MTEEMNENPAAESHSSGTLPAGTLFVVGTPIGNLQDMPPRAVETLRHVDLILVEDTRSFHTLARRFHIDRPLRSYFEHNEKQRAPEIVELLKSGKRVALVSEAGTPAISDPGYRVVRACREAGVAVTGVPGPNAAIFALSVSGLPSDRFTFQGFLPQRPGRRLSTIGALLSLEGTSILYESPFRLVKTLADIGRLAPNRDVFVARELTKLHEECVWGKVEEVLTKFQKRDSIKGEIVIVVSGCSDESPAIDTEELSSPAEES